MKFSLFMILAFGYVGPVLADNLADIRQDLANLLLEADRLQLEMLTTPGIDFSNEGSLLDRTSAIESELQRLTGATEESANRISIVVQDVYRRIKTLETSVCALEPGCNVTELGSSLPVGVISNGLTRTSMLEETLTITEKSDFDAVKKILARGETETAVQMLKEFIAEFPVGPLTQKVHLLLGHAHMDLLEFRLAARAYLEAYSVNEGTEIAPVALYNLALAFHKMGNAKEGCLTLDEVKFRYSGAEIVVDALQAEADLACT
jgi:TolA-binding protein|tara:strand:+ start:1936 stop:2724 length:789 start_codon:yes stop_codon:yes gene_type:complete